MSSRASSRPSTASTRRDGTSSFAWACATPHVAASRLAWKIARALAARGWSLTNLAVSRRWRFRDGSSSWTAQAYVSFFFDDLAPRGPGAVYAVHFEGKGSARALESSALFQGLRSRLGEGYTLSRSRQTPARPWLARGVRGETRPRVVLAELDRIARAFGSADAHASPRSRARSPSARLWPIGEAVLAHGTWSLETPGVRLPPGAGAWASISPMPASGRGRPELQSSVC
jgi:hypothetical protein